MRVVVDTNILISFAIRPSLDFERLFDYLSLHSITLISVETVEELQNVLNRPKFRKYISQDSALEYSEWYIGISETVTACLFSTANKHSSWVEKGPINE